jgi:hypothetical protein
MPDILVTGMPRSGTTLAMSLLNRHADTIALAEPFLLAGERDRHSAVETIIASMQDFRARALAGAPIPTKHVGGEIPDNWVEPPQQNGRLRRVLEERGAILFDKPLTADFALVVKHPAEFTALADLLTDHFPLYAMVRDPLAVLASWQTVDMPINRGRMPMLEQLAPPSLSETLEGIDSPLERQVTLLEFQMKTYLTLPRERIIRYEDLLADPGTALAPLCPGIEALPGQAAYQPVPRYPGVDFNALARPLTRLLPLIEEFYPEFRSRWADHLPT